MASVQSGKMIVGLDIGTSKVVALVGEVAADGQLEVVGIGTHPSRGLKKGVVVNIESTVQAIQHAIDVAQQMAGLTLIQADVTNNTADDKALLKRFQLFGPPGIIFFKDGKEVGRVVGFEDAKTFLASMQRAGV